MERENQIFQRTCLPLVLIHVAIIAFMTITMVLTMPSMRITG